MVVVWVREARFAVVVVVVICNVLELNAVDAGERVA